MVKPTGVNRGLDEDCIRPFVAQTFDGFPAPVSGTVVHDTGERRVVSVRSKEAIEGLALQKPPLPVTAIHRQVRRLAQGLGDEPPSYWVVYRIVTALPADLLTLAHEGTKAYSDAFELVHRREADRPNAIWQADHTPLDIRPAGDSCLQLLSNTVLPGTR